MDGSDASQVFNIPAFTLYFYDKFGIHNTMRTNSRAEALNMRAWLECNGLTAWLDSEENRRKRKPKVMGAGA